MCNILNYTSTICISLTINKKYEVCTINKYFSIILSSEKYNMDFLLLYYNNSHKNSHIHLIVELG